MMAEKAKEIAILKALGATDGAILRTFMTEGDHHRRHRHDPRRVDRAGALHRPRRGSACGSIPDVYYIDRLPINVSALDYGIVTLAALTICTLATIFPARQASQLRPVDGLRYE